MTHEQGFLKEIIGNPDDDTPRLIYADWLEERSHSERAEFIRVQCEQSRLALRDPRRSTLAGRSEELLKAHQSTWDQDLQPFGYENEYRRGFVERMAFLNGREFLEAAPFLFRLTPFRQLDLRLLWDEELQEVRNSLYLAQLSILHIDSRGWDIDDLRALLSSPHLSNLKTLDLCGNDYNGPEGAHLMAKLRHLGRLTTLDMRGNLIGPDGMAALADAAHLHGLTTLLLGIPGYNDTPNEIGPEGVRALATSRYLVNLKILDLEENQIGDEGVAALTSSPNVSHLTELVLSFNELTDRSARLLAECPSLSNLTLLQLDGNDIGNKGVAALAKSLYLNPSLELVLDSETISERAWKKLQKRFVNLYDEPGV